MRIGFAVTAVVFLSCISAANAAAKTVHDKDNGFSLTFPEGWRNEAPSGKTMRLKIKSGDQGLTCRISVGHYDPQASGSPADPKAFLETGWSPQAWQEMVGAAFTSAAFSNEKLIRFPDGYPARMADMDFQVGDGSASFPGHAKVVLSLRGSHFGLVTCGLTGDSLEQMKQKWAPLADEAERVASSFVLDRP
ncbi:hypothetical protein ACVILI_000457 [Mesorhizobium sp. USDA 4775]|uniref:hypothetical protein n=1 Tax=Mesorhizobium jarvisii TaxID=1777867 RepID=UPI00049AF1BE|nr:hypothetical protein [Mesorhizobium jarvisii]AID33093.1 hypothetical protein MCHK_5299 [Mesorhizobium huakuii 7653R]MCH4557400.1 hypothetical protein [Mesorhizobium jarvisii]